MLPTLFLVPKLYGKIEPLLGMKPRTVDNFAESTSAISPKAIVISIIGFIVAIGAELLAESGFELIDWEASWAESTGSMTVAMIIAVVVTAIVAFWMRRNAQLKQAS